MSSLAISLIAHARQKARRMIQPGRGDTVHRALAQEDRPVLHTISAFLIYLGSKALRHRFVRERAAYQGGYLRISPQRRCQFKISGIPAAKFQTLSRWRVVHSVVHVIAASSDAIALTDSTKTPRSWSHDFTLQITGRVTCLKDRGDSFPRRESETLA